MGYTQTEKDNYERSGFHNYKEFINALDDLLVNRYGANHHILYKKELIDHNLKKYGKKVDNHIVTFDLTYCCQEARIIEDFKGKVFERDGREMWMTFLITGDIEETIIG